MADLKEELTFAGSTRTWLNALVRKGLLDAEMAEAGEDDVVWRVKRGAQQRAQAALKWQVRTTVPRKPVGVICAGSLPTQGSPMFFRYAAKRSQPELKPHRNIVGAERKEIADKIIEELKRRVPTPSVVELAEEIGRSHWWVREVLGEEGVNARDFVGYGAFAGIRRATADVLGDPGARAGYALALLQAKDRDSRTPLKNIARVTGLPQRLTHTLLKEAENARRRPRRKAEAAERAEERRRRELASAMRTAERLKEAYESPAAPSMLALSKGFRISPQKVRKLLVLADTEIRPHGGVPRSITQARKAAARPGAPE
jgi:hypothetical protein